MSLEKPLDSLRFVTTMSGAVCPERAMEMSLSSSIPESEPVCPCAVAERAEICKIRVRLFKYLRGHIRIIIGVYLDAAARGFIP